MAASIMKVRSFFASQGAPGKRAVWDGMGQPRGCRMCVSDGLWAVAVFFHPRSEYLI